MSKPSKDMGSAPVCVGDLIRLARVDFGVFAVVMFPELHDGKQMPAAQWLDASADRAGRLKVEPDLTVPGHPEIFAIGDSAIVARADGRPVPGIAPAAKQEGAYVAAMIRARLRG